MDYEKEKVVRNIQKSLLKMQQNGSNHSNNVTYENRTRNKGTAPTMWNLSKGLCKDDRNKRKCSMLIGDKQNSSININAEKDSKGFGYSIIAPIACFCFRG